MSKHIDFIDIAKGIGILLVVVGHLRDTQLCSLAKTIIFSFHMPLFFIIAGLNFNYDKYANSFTAFFKHRFLRLMVPYFIFNIFLIAYITDNYTNLTVLQKYYTVLYGVGSKFWTWELTALWFLPSLFCAEIIFYFLIKSTREFIEVQFLVLFLFCILGYEASKLFYKGAVFPWSIDVSFISILFMYIGWKFRSFNFFERLNSYNSNRHRVICVLLLICFTAIIHFNGWPDMNARRFNTLLEFYAGGVAGSIIVAYISILMLKQIWLKNLFVLLGQNSLYIMILHLFSARIFYGNLFQEFPGFGLLMDNNPAMCSVLYVLWAILFSLFFAYLVKYSLVAIRYLPMKIRNKGA